MSHTSSLRRPRLLVEQLEGRALPAQVDWINPAGGYWSDPANWSTGQLPGADDDVVIDLPEDVIVRHTEGTSIIRSLLSRETLLLFGGTLATAADSVLDGPVELLGGTLDGAGTITSNSFFSWGAGGIRGSAKGARLIANHSLSLYGPQDKTLAGSSLEVTRQASMIGGPLVLDQAAFTVGPLAHMNVDGTQFRETGASRFTNYGSMYVWNSAFATHWVDNTGTIDVFSGRLDLGVGRGSVDSTGSFHLTAGASLGASSESVAFGGAVWGSGNLSLGGDSVSVNGGIDLDGRVSVGGWSARISGTVHAGQINMGGSRLVFSGEISADRISVGGDVGGNGSLTARSLVFSGGYTSLADMRITADIFENHSMLELWDSTVIAEAVVSTSRFFLQQGTVVSATTFYNRGWLNGVGTIRGHVINDSWLVVGGLDSSGTLTIEGNYTQTTNGELHVILGGAEPGTGYSQLQVTGLAILNGRLVVRLLDGFVPEEGQSFDVLTFSGRVGSFQTVEVPQFDDGLFLDSAYGDAAFALVAARR